MRSKVFGTPDRPRLCVFKSNKQIYAQVINDEESKTLVEANSMKMDGKTMTEKAKIVGEEIAKKAKGKKIEKVVFDKAGFTYIGVIKEIAEAARKGGLIF